MAVSSAFVEVTSEASTTITRQRPVFTHSGTDGSTLRRFRGGNRRGATPSFKVHFPQRLPGHLNLFAWGYPPAHYWERSESAQQVLRTRLGHPRIARELPDLRFRTPPLGNSPAMTSTGNMRSNQAGQRFSERCR